MRKFRFTHDVTEGSTSVEERFIIQLSKYVIVSVGGLLINHTILFVATEFLYIYYLISEILAIGIVTLYNFLLNKFWSFSDYRYGVDTVSNQFLKYALVGASGVIVNLTLLALLTEIFHLYYLISATFSYSTAIFTNFTLNKYWTFKK